MGALNNPNNPYYIGTQRNSSNSAEVVNTNPLEGPANVDTSYVFGDWLSGGSAAKQQQANQSNLDYAEWVRNEFSAKAQRDWEEYMSNTQVQRSMKDLQAAGLNPWLAVQSAGFGGAVPTGAAASSSAGQAASTGASAGASIGAMAATAYGLAKLVKVIAKVVK